MFLWSRNNGKNMKEAENLSTSELLDQNQKLLIHQVYEVSRITPLEKANIHKRKINNNKDMRLPDSMK